MGQLYSMYNRAVSTELKQIHKQFAGTYVTHNNYNILNVQPNNSITITNHTTTHTTETDNTVLNNDTIINGANSTIHIAQQLNKHILSLQGTYIDENTGKVQYTDIAKSIEFQEYINATRTQLRNIDLYKLDILQRKVLLLNIYNALVIHGNIVLGVSAMSGLKSFYSNTSYMFGRDTILSLDDIEHGILRNNAPHPITHKQRFTSTDIRIQLCVPVDNRIHFALNCGAASCPPIRVYTEDNIERALTLATKSFIKQQSNLTVNMNTHIITVSKLFDWYKVDFGSTNEHVLQFIVRQLDGNKQADAIEQLLASKKYTLKYSAYDWSVNSH